MTQREAAAQVADQLQQAFEALADLYGAGNENARAVHTAATQLNQHLHHTTAGGDLNAIKGDCELRQLAAHLRRVDEALAVQPAGNGE